MSFNTIQTVPGIFLCLISLIQLQAQPTEACRWVRANGKTVSFDQVVAACKTADVVFLGEHHNNPIVHWQHTRLLKALAKELPGLSLGMEMFERDQQPALDSVILGGWSLKRFADSTRVWPNYATDYAPMIKFCRDHGIRVWATNVPRTYPRLVARNGLMALPDAPDFNPEHAAPLPIVVDYSLPSYQQMLEMMAGHGMGTDSLQARQFVQAQAIKDATMAHVIGQNHARHRPLLHVNGTYHSDYFEGIVWYLRRNHPNLKVVVLSTQETTPNLSDWKPASKTTTRRLADYILLVPEDMTKTY
jgi:uncharacterized iron-regulated protein